MRRILFWTFVKLQFFLLSCSFSQDKKESYLIIAIEEVPYTSEICAEYNQQEDNIGFQDLCEHFVRFTHMVSPSTQSQAVLASVLTGLYPMEHNVWHNGNLYLSEKHQTLSEDFFENGWQTFFYSGGGSIWRKSGLAQGFSVFDDYVPIHVNNYYRPAKESFLKFKNWLAANEDPFFTFFYIPDLLFPTVPTKNEIGEKRESSYKGQKRALSRSLKNLFDFLRQHNRWHNTNIIVFGINGKTRDIRAKEHDAYNLLSENTQVAFFYKAATKKRDTSITWKDDNYYSLVDFGYSLKKKFHKNLTSELPLERSDILDAQARKDKKSHWILIESAWPYWRKKSSVRYALRKGNLLYLFDENIKKYNSLIDRLELNPQILKKDDLPEDVIKLKKDLEISLWSPLSFDEIEKIKLGEMLWNPLEKTINTEGFLKLYKSSEDQQILEWLATIALRQKDWSLLEEIASFSNNKLWSFTAKYHTNKLKKKDWELLDNSCVLKFLANEKRKKGYRVSENLECSSKKVNLLYYWIHSKGEKRIEYRERLVRHIVEQRIQENIFKLHYLADLSWDISLRYPRYPSTLDILLSYDKYKVYNRFLQNRLEIEQDDQVVY